MGVRVQKILSQWGVASRREAEQWITEGRVRLNGAIASLGQTADPEYDRIEVNGMIVQAANRPASIYLLLNKPAGVVATCHDPQARKTVLELLPPELQSGCGIHPVGRLDANSTGALLLTNDGDLTYLLTHPRHQISKTYRVWVEGYPAATVLQQWQQGVGLDGRQTLPAQVAVVRRHPTQRTLLEIRLKEGRNRQIRRVAELLGHPVLHLHRTEIGSIQLNSPVSGSLTRGTYRSLTEAEIGFLKSQIDLSSIRVPAKRSFPYE